MPLADLSPERRELLASMERQTRLDGHEIVARRLKSNGVTHVYGISGTPVDETLAACGGQGIRVIATRHQQAAVQAAAAHNYLAGGLKAAVIVSAGPGVSNCVTGATVAYANHWPLLVIGGRRPLAMRGMGAFQELDGASLFTSLTRHSALIEDTSGLADQIDRACQLAMHRQPGPCYLDIAEEALQGAATYRDAAPQPDYTPAVLIDQDTIMSALQRARRPVLAIGEGIRWGDPWVALEHLVGNFHIPFVTSPMARGYLPDSHVLCGTRVRTWLLGSADLVLIAGASLDWVFRHGAEMHPDATLVRLGHESDPVFLGRSCGLEYLGEPADLLRQVLAALQMTGTGIRVDETWLGEFALGLDIMDLETAVRHQLPLVILVANNSGSDGRLRQKTYWPPDYPERVCQFTPGIRYDLIMQAMGGEGILIDHAGQVLPALEQAFASGRPTLIQVDTRDDVPLPCL